MSEVTAPLRVYILAYNRPEYILESVKSVLSQGYPEFEVIVSDNSTDPNVSQILREVNDPRFKIIERKPSLPPIDHFNKVLEDAESSQFFMLFHDDDILLPGALKSLMGAFESSTVAVGSNAYILKDNKVTKKLLAPKAKSLSTQNSGSLAESYLDDNLWHPAFPSYIYKSSSVKGIRFDRKRGRKYCDVTFLMDLAEKGQIKMLAEPLMQYRLHSSSDSASFDIKASHSLKRALSKFKNISRSTLDTYFYKAVLRWSLQRSRDKTFKLSKREKTLLRKAIAYALVHPSIFTKALKKRFSNAS